MERDEVYVPKTRRDLHLPKDVEEKFDYEEYFGDTPIYTLLMLIRQQLLAFPAYLRASLSSYLCTLLIYLMPKTSVQRLRTTKVSQMDKSL